MKYIGNNERGASTRWKERGVIPEGAIRVLYLQSGVRREWIETGEGPMRDPDPAPQVREDALIYEALNDPDIMAVVKMMVTEDKPVRSDIRLGVQKEKLLQGMLRQKESNEKAG